MASWYSSGVSRLSVYLVAGVATYMSTFRECSYMLERMFGEQGIAAAMNIMFPYGDYSRSLWRQIWEVRSDFTRALLPSRIGARSMLRELERSFSGGPILLIGHSGGGVAAYQTAKMLLQQGLEADKIRIVQVGSPKMPIIDALRDHVAYFHSVDEKGRISDPITRIGSWGGWLRGSRSLPIWHSFRHAPAHIQGIPILGGHTNYFRHQLPYVDERSLSNLDKTVAGIVDWLQKEPAHTPS